MALERLLRSPGGKYDELAAAKGLASLLTKVYQATKPAKIKRTPWYLLISSFDHYRWLWQDRKPTRGLLERATSSMSLNYRRHDGLPSKSS